MPSQAAQHAHWRLPEPAARLLFGALPVAERLLCREVCPAWRAAIDSDPFTWAHLDLRPYAAQPLVAQGRLLRCVAARAVGVLRTLALALPGPHAPARARNRRRARGRVPGGAAQRGSEAAPLERAAAGAAGARCVA
jgi:hypothetical protein